QPTQEMSVEDWDGLRARFGPDQPVDVEQGPQGEGEPEPYSFLDQFLPRHDEEEPSPGPSAPQAVGEEADVAAGEEPETGRPPITIDDLRKAPEAYRDLPPPLDEPAAVPADEAEAEAH